MRGQEHRCPFLAGFKGLEADGFHWFRLVFMNHVPGPSMFACYFQVLEWRIWRPSQVATGQRREARLLQYVREQSKPGPQHQGPSSARR